MSNITQDGARAVVSSAQTDTLRDRTVWLDRASGLGSAARELPRHAERLHAVADLLRKIDFKGQVIDTLLIEVLVQIRREREAELLAPAQPG